MLFSKVPYKVVSFPLEGGHAQRVMLSPVHLMYTVALPLPGERSFLGALLRSGNCWEVEN